MQKLIAIWSVQNILCGWLNCLFLIYLNYINININKINFGVVVWIFMQKA